MAARAEPALRRTLDALYDVAGGLAALSLVGILAMVMLGVAGRMLDFHVPGTDAYAGYCMAGAGFLALAHTLKRGEHIRVSLVLEHVGAAARRGLELWSLAAATALAGAFAFYSVRLAYQSWQFNDISTGNDATPLWIPQIAMALGTLVFAIALADDFVLELRSRRAHTAPAEALHNE
jgi:TRAP-type C4-dicarboxylate transport system permease small subunit